MSDQNLQKNQLKIKLEFFTYVLNEKHTKIPSVQSKKSVLSVRFDLLNTKISSLRNMQK